MRDPHQAPDSARTIADDTVARCFSLAGIRKCAWFGAAPRGANRAIFPSAGARLFATSIAATGSAAPIGAIATTTAFAIADYTIACPVGEAGIGKRAPLTTAPCANGIIFTRANWTVIADRTRAPFINDNRTRSQDRKRGRKHDAARQHP